MRTEILEQMMNAKIGAIAGTTVDVTVLSGRKKGGKQMKASELMLGDIITFKDSVETDENPIPIKVIALGYQHSDDENEALVQIGNNETCDLVTIDDEFVGYPLTAEILEKNKMREFEHRNPGQGDNLIKKWWHKDGSYYVSLYRVGDEYTYTVGNTITRVCRIKYIHQLQHALRLCGIDKTIIL